MWSELQISWVCGQIRSLIWCAKILKAWAEDFVILGPKLVDWMPKFCEAKMRFEKKIWADFLSRNDDWVSEKKSVFVRMKCCWWKGSLIEFLNAWKCRGQNVQIFLEIFDENRRFFWWECRFEKADFWWKWGVENADFRGGLQCLKRPFFAENSMGNVVQSSNRWV